MENKDIKDRITTCLADEKVYKFLLGYLACFLAYFLRGKLANVRIHFRNQKGITPSISEIVRIDENGKAECSYCGDVTRSDYEPEFSRLLDKVLNMVSA